MTVNAKKFTGYLLNGDELSCEEYLESLAVKEDILKVLQLFTEAMQHVGELWENNEISVADEHLATATCDYVLSYYKFRYITRKTPIKHNKKAMFLCLENEQHYLGTKIIASVFESFGWNVRLFGANLPLEYACSQAEEWKPDIIGISVSILYHLPKLNLFIEGLSATSSAPGILVGGRLSRLYDLMPYCTAQTTILKNIDEVSRWLEEQKVEENADDKNNQHTNPILSTK
ncbi:cobalamin B12-binding domain-containing protein [Pseudalkalibacillus sp. R45]|uniref:cobalamin B12-binding domain-containing protein n=1 Tax=Pseudalkalibacillus sp. R45 TaxID=3457433 RepID=UPI003FCD3180